MVALLSLLVCVSSLLERDSKYILHKIITLHTSNKVNGMADRRKKVLPWPYMSHVKF